MTIDQVSSLVGWLQFLATTGGAGWAATALIGWLRCRYPAPVLQPGIPARWGYLALHAPRYTRYTSIALTVGLGSAAAMALNLVTGADAAPLLNGFSAFAFSQVLHGFAALSPTMPALPSAADGSQ